MTRAAVVQEAHTWLGTPYHHHGRIKGAGVDCAMLLAEVFTRCKLVAPVDPGAYPIDWHLHRTEEIFIQWLQRAGAHQVLAASPGDIAIYQFGRTFSHGAIVVDDIGTVVHSYLRLGVISTRPTEEPLQGRPVQFWSIFDKGTQ